jgi:hypothetical protein
VFLVVVKTRRKKKSEGAIEPRPSPFLEMVAQEAVVHTARMSPVSIEIRGRKKYLEERGVKKKKGKKTSSLALFEL